jgi:hypothetical protein
MSLKSAKQYLNTTFYTENEVPKAFLFLEESVENLRRITQDLEEYKSPLNGSILNFFPSCEGSNILIMTKQNYVQPVLQAHLRHYFGTNFPGHTVVWMLFKSGGLCNEEYEEAMLKHLQSGKTAEF